MNLFACSNCCYNALQYGPLGLSIGYCVEHRVVLRQADETTCPRHVRKDLGGPSRETAHDHHRARYPLDVVQSLRTAAPATDDPAIVDPDTRHLEEDPVGEAVTSYGSLDSKIASLAQLRAIPGARAELAMLSLGRGYVRRCLLRGGRWTSGLHLFWWTRKRIADEPVIGVRDFRHETAASLVRQFELAAWSIVMLRLHLLADVGGAAPKDDGVSVATGLVDDAAEATDLPDLASVLAWIRGTAEPRLEHALPRQRYGELRDALHRDQCDAPPAP